MGAGEQRCRGERDAPSSDMEQLDFDEDMDERKCWNCKRRYQVRLGQKVKHCPWCGAAQTRGSATRPWDDSRVAQEL